MDKTQLINTIKKWQKILGLSNWDINVTYNDDGRKNKIGSYVTILTSTSYPEYCVAEINVKRLRSVDEKDVVHELVHVLLSDFTDYVYEESTLERKRLLSLEEKVVSQLTHIIWRTKND